MLGALLQLLVSTSMIYGTKEAHMVSKLIKKDNSYICSECKMRQPDDLKSNCFWCGNWFSNYEELMVEEEAEIFLYHLKEQDNYVKKV